MAPPNQLRLQSHGTFQSGLRRENAVILFPQSSMKRQVFIPLMTTALSVVPMLAQGPPPLPAPMSIPKPGPASDGPYAPQAILPGGVVIPLYPPGSPFLKADKVREPEQYNMSQAVPGRISSI